MKSKKFPIIAAATIVITSLLLVSTGGAKAESDLSKIINVELDKLVPNEFKQFVSQIQTGGAIGIDKITSVFKSGDENGNINEDQWKTLGQAALSLSAEKEIREAGLGTSYTMGQLAQAGLNNINNLNNRKGRETEKAIVNERADIQNILKRNAQPADSSLQAENQRNEIAAAAVATDLRKLDLQARSLTAQQIANANTLQERQEQLSKRRSEQIAAKAGAEERIELMKVITQPYYGGKE